MIGRETKPVRIEMRADKTEIAHRLFQFPKTPHAARRIDPGEAGEAGGILLADFVHALIGNFERSLDHQIAGADGNQQRALAGGAVANRRTATRSGAESSGSAAGGRLLGSGAVFGLSDWLHETLCLAVHAQYLLRHCWKSQLTISLPRLRPCAGEFKPLTDFHAHNLVQAICALRQFLPDAGIVLSTREPARLRDRLIPLGITMMSAGSHTEPGGYTGAGQDNLHYTERGRIRELVGNASDWATHATGQFDIADDREPSAVAATVTRLGYEPVWKDWDPAILSN